MKNIPAEPSHEECKALCEELSNTILDQIPDRTPMGAALTVLTGGMGMAFAKLYAGNDVEARLCIARSVAELVVLLRTIEKEIRDADKEN